MNLSAMMGSYPKTEALKTGRVSSPDFTLTWSPIEVAQKGFKAVVRRMEFDVAEIAIVTFLQAFAAGKPYVLLPFVMNGNFHHKSLLCRADSTLSPGDLAGRRVAMRSYAQTTPTWVRGILSDEYDVRVDSVQWMSQEEAHVAEYRDPPWVSALDSSAGLEGLLIAGEVDAIIAGGGLTGDARIRPMIPSPAESSKASYARTGVVPINHMVAVRKELASTQPDVIRELFRMLCESRSLSEQGSPPRTGPELQPIGFEAVEPALKTVIRYAHEQRLIPELLPVEALYGDVTNALTRTLA